MTVAVCVRKNLLPSQAAAPGLAWSTFFEEPAMLLAFVLLGRTLEQRAKIAASSNLLALQVCNLPCNSPPVHLSVVHSLNDSQR
jgi:cation transport ATPase